MTPPGGRRAPQAGPSGRRVVAAGLVLVAVATMFRWWQVQGTWFFYDDLYFIQRALEEPLSWSYLVKPYNGHLMPAGALLTWANAQIDPMSYSWPAAEIVLFFAAAGLSMLRLLVRLFGSRWEVLVPLVAFLFSPMLIPATIWWAAAVNQGPMLIAIISALTSFVAYLREPRWPTLAATFAWMAFGLLFVERTLVGFPMLWLVALLYFTAGSLQTRLHELWRRYRAAVVVQVAAVGVYLALYVPFALNFDAGSVRSRPLFGVLRDLGGVAFPVGVTGGPLDWQVSGVTQSEAHPSQLLLVLSWTVLATIVVASAMTRRNGLRAWLIPLSSLMANVALISVSRAIYFGSEIALDYRFQTESALAVALALGLAFLPVPGARQSAQPRPEATWSITTPSWVVVSTAVFLAVATVSTANYPLRNLTTTSAERYYRNVDAGLRADPDVHLLNRTTPSWLWAPLAYPTNTYRHMFRMVTPDVSASNTVTDAAKIVDETGRLRTIDFETVRTQRKPAGSGGCFVHASDDTRRWTLDGPVLGPDWYLRLSYDAPVATDATISVGEREVDVHLQAGEHSLLTAAPGSYSSVDVRLEDGSPAVCLQRLEIGSVSPGA